MRNSISPFRPVYGTTIQCPATTTTSRVAIPTAAIPPTTVRVIHSTGTSGVRWRAGSSTVNAITLTDPMQLPGSVEVYNINAGDTHIAVITDAGTGTLEFTFGSGN